MTESRAVRASSCRWKKGLTAQGQEGMPLGHGNVLYHHWVVVIQVFTFVTPSQSTPKKDEFNSK